MTGVVLPFLAGLGFLAPDRPAGLLGTDATSASFALVFATAIAITSIPVITRIMYDLGILDTAFARIVLSVAVIEDVALYVVLAVALGIAAGTAHVLRPAGRPGAGARDGADIAYHVVVTVAMLWVFLVPVRRLYSRAAASRFNVLHRRGPVAHQLLFMLACTVGCLALGVEAFFGAFLAGVAVGSSQETGEALAAIRGFSFAFFIPIYFAVVGLQLDLLHGFSVWFFVGFLVRVRGQGRLGVPGRAARRRAAVRGPQPGRRDERPRRPRHRARVGRVRGRCGEPVLLRHLVMLAIVTSLLAGSWLERVPRDRLRERPEPKPGAPPRGPAAAPSTCGQTSAARAAPARMDLLAATRAGCTRPT